MRNFSLHRAAAVLFLLAVPCLLPGGTLIYRDAGGGQKIISNVKILSIDSASRLITLEMENGVETIASGRLIKYYSSDIKAGNMFEDNSDDYSITVSDIDLPQYTRHSGKSRGKKQSRHASIVYNIRSSDMNVSYRTPLFYLFLLTTKDGVRKVSMVCYPNSARISSKFYDEAKMLEKALDLGRACIHPRDRSRLGLRQSGGKEKSVMGGCKIDLPLSGAPDGEIIASYLVVWGKNRIIYTREDHKNGESIDKNWVWRHAYDKR